MGGMTIGNFHNLELAKAIDDVEGTLVEDDISVSLPFLCGWEHDPVRPVASEPPNADEPTADADDENMEACGRAAR